MSNGLARLSAGEFEEAVKNGTSKTARKAKEAKQATNERDIDRPKAFTKRARDSLAKSKGSLAYSSARSGLEAGTSR